MPLLLGPQSEKQSSVQRYACFDNALSEAGCPRCYLFERLAIRAQIGLEHSQRNVALTLSTLAKGDDCCRDVVRLWRITSVLTDTLENSFKQISRLTP